MRRDKRARGDLSSAMHFDARTAVAQLPRGASALGNPIGYPKLESQRLSAKVGGGFDRTGERRG